ncbi:MAG: universal stress protein [Gammaproteobacteria bacterium]|nr:universal stress protein [Gammaproteobacteria bacterium]MDH3373059.1 universal stress protein [Gammaproteobacteria bacterium]MDH3408939.1 universal stress protein [Gammaproteobacteria bacterium]MDH3553693.1 universal stress protein [Gammaproteobacteria bacterium]
MTYKNILVAVDITDEAEDVIRAAREIAEEQNSKISAVTVIRPMADFYVNLYSTLEDSADIGIESRAVISATAWLSDLLKRYDIDAGAGNVIIGTPAVEVRRLAEKIDADLIVLGTHGRHGLGLLLGSTANAVLHGAPCDVLAVKVRAEGPE